MRKCGPWLLAVLLALPALAQTPEGNLVQDPGFEQPPAPNPYVGWVFVSHEQDFIRGETEAQDYHGGLKAAAVSVGGPPKVYACWAQHVLFKTDNEAPDTVSVWYRAPQPGATIVMSFAGVREGQVQRKGSTSFALEPSRDWKQFTAALDVPAGTTDIQLELRVTAQGEYKFDDVALWRAQADQFTGKPNRLLIVNPDRDSLTDLWQQELKQAGWARVSCETWENLTPELLKQCRVVALLGLPFRSDLTAQDVALADLLVDYVNQGGGVLLSQNNDQIITGMTLYFYLAERFGTRVLMEKTFADPNQTKRFGSWWADTFSYTDQVSAPLNEGVKGMVYQSHVEMASLSGVLPFLPQAPWRVVLTAGPKSRSEVYLSGLEEVDKNARAAGFAGDVPLAGVRELGKGRVAYLGQKPLAVFFRAMKTADDRKVYEDYLRAPFNDQPNDTVRFYLNAFQWLGAGADALEAASLQLAKAAPVQYTTAYKLHRGIIGPRTTCSSGRSTPEEYVRKARAAGLDFIVFLEDFASLKPGGFEQLKQDCARLSTADFLAIPGLTYENSDGNHEYACSEALRLPSKRLLTADGKRLAVYPRGADKEGVCNEQTWLYQLLGFENTSGWYDFAHNPYPFYDARDVNAQGVVVQANGQPGSLNDQYLGAQARSGQLLWPQALTLMKSADEIDLIGQGVYFQNIVGADGTQMLHTLLNTLPGRSARNLYPGAPCFGSTSVTNGPIIELFMPRGDTDAQGDPFNPALQEWPLDLKVTAPAGLRTVQLMDGDRLIRQFLPGGQTEFTYHSQVAKERQKYLWVRVLDRQGHSAVSRDVQCDSWLLRDQQCADRNNQLLYSSQRRPDGSEYYVGYGGDTTLADKGPWNGRVRPIGCFVFDSKLGSGAMSYDGSPENHPQAMLNPYVVYDGKVPEAIGWSRRVVQDQEGGPHVQARRVVSSSDVLIGDRILDGIFPYDCKPVIHVWHTLYPVKPSQYLATTARCSFYLPKVDGISAYLWEQTFQAKQNLPVKADQPFTFGLGTISGGMGTTDRSERLLVSNGQVVDRGPVKGKPMQVVPFKRGTYLCFLRAIFGSLAVYSLSDDLVLWGDGVNYQVGVKTPAGVVAPAKRYEARLLMVGINRLVADPEKLAAQVLTDYGIAGKPSYQVKAEAGQVLDQQYLLTLGTDPRVGFRGQVTGLDALAGNLGTVVLGCKDNWSAILQVQDGSGKTRLIPVEEGHGYAALRASEGGKRLFLGHPLVADSDSVVISLARSKDWKTWIAEIHNPTEKPLTVRVRANPNAEGFKLDEKLQLPAGSSVFREVGKAGG